MAGTMTEETVVRAGRAGGSNRDRAYAELKRRILGNTLPAGTQMLEEEVAGMLGMSRTPVREALLALAADGLVEIRPRHGMRVLPISADDMTEIYVLLTTLEAEAARLAALRDLDRPILDALDNAVDDMDRALADRDLDAWAEADSRFHGHLVEASGNRRLIQIVSTMADQAHRVRMATLRLRPFPDASNVDHREVLEAIRRGAAKDAQEAHRAHRERSGRMLVDLIRRGGPTEF